MVLWVFHFINVMMRTVHKISFCLKISYVSVKWATKLVEVRSQHISLYILNTSSKRIIFDAGDTGGPLMAVDRSNRFKAYVYLAGILSFGPSPCGSENSPNVYTVRVKKSLDYERII